MRLTNWGFKGGRKMNQLDVAGILMTYSAKARYARDKEHLKDIIRELKEELDLRKVTFDNQEN